MDTWLDSPYIYDIYGTNDGDSKTVTTQVRYEGGHTDMLGLNRASYRSNLGVGEGKRLLLKFGRRGKVKREAT